MMVTRDQWADDLLAGHGAAARAAVDAWAEVVVDRAAQAAHDYAADGYDGGSVAWAIVANLLLDALPRDDVREAASRIEAAARDGHAARTRHAEV